MLKRIILVVALLFTVLTMAPPAYAQEATWTEGAYLNIGPGACGIQGGGFNLATLTASKFVDRVNRTRVSDVNLYLTNGITPANLVYTLIGPVTVGVPGDPDNLSVSRDLGWAGLDTSVSVFDFATNTTVMVDIHLSWLANGSVVQEGNLYKRPATVTGTVVANQHNFTMPACGKTAYIFSTREPKPRY
jgi:hypothetical protein